MISVSDAVQKLIRRSPFLDEALTMNIVNISALSRLIKPDVEKEVMKEIQEGAVIMALRRLAESLQKDTQKQKRLFPNPPDLMIRSNLIDLTFVNSEYLIQKQRKLLEQIDGGQSSFITFTQGIYETTIISSRNLRNKIMAAFKGEKLLFEMENLSSLTVKLTSDTTFVPGAYNFILKALAWEGINLIEVVSTFTELTIILEDKDIDRSFSLLKRIF